jgi:hypothetical protein
MMKKIGIYKPFKAISFSGSNSETAAWSYEVVNLFDMLKNKGHDVKMLSECDRPELYGDGIYINGQWQHTDIKYDTIIIVGGSFDLNAQSENEVIGALRARCRELVLLVTDQKLIPSNVSSWRHFNRVLTQSTKAEIIRDNNGWIDDSILVGANNVSRSFTEELVLYNFKNEPRNYTLKNSEFYFGGGERGRTKSFFEYVYRPGHNLNIKSTSLGIDNRVSFATHTKMLADAKYTIVIADELYNKTGFLTPRQYEAWMVDTIAFVEKDYDPQNKIYPANSFLRVSSYLEMRKKIQELNNNLEKMKSIIDWQRSQITPEMVTGKTICSIIIK